MQEQKVTLSIMWRTYLHSWKIKQDTQGNIYSVIFSQQRVF